ncbi:hypothetical protein CN151_10880 [Sinorhizobium meliloti]|uniref:NAD(+)--rifampin ADP-ribosyltransferase n=1 Tax=Rhizobium meliloti TaxID=382 RepID=UPI000FD61A34|nr:NAD(+)--rifampin ADP-ribosyltransferase [Sinorhizobium meliloti]RVL05139.1 hypothetical protein CN151_10880 [Sinorhizobium meliloti]
MTGVRYFHGGFGGLTVGQFVLPPAKTRAPSTARFGAASVCNTNKVYLCTDMDGALVYACMHFSGRGKVYEVEPIGDLTLDPDAKVAGISFECDKARVLRVIRVPGKTIKLVQREMLREGA